MPKTPTIAEILTEFEAEIARAPRFASVDRALLQRLIDDHRRLPPRTPQGWVDAHRKFARKDVRDKQTLIAQIDALCDEIDRLNPRQPARAAGTGGGGVSLFSSEETSTAYLSADGRYRYDLTRTWDPEGTTAMWIMLNPSTADADVDDPTIRRCIGFSKSWGHGRLVVCNLFAFRATRPKALWIADDPIGGDENHRVIRAHMARADVIVAAWGVGVARHATFPSIAAYARWADKPVCCLGVTKDGHPRHPLYVQQAQQLERYR